MKGQGKGRFPGRIVQPKLGLENQRGPCQVPQGRNLGLVLDGPSLSCPAPIFHQLLHILNWTCLCFVHPPWKDGKIALCPPGAVRFQSILHWGLFFYTCFFFHGFLASSFYQSKPTLASGVIIFKLTSDHSMLLLKILPYPTIY